MQSYCEIASVTHFVFRYTVPIRHCDFGSISGGSLSQCYSPPMNFIDEEVSNISIWNAYQKLSLRLRLGSSSSESITKAFDEMQTSERSTNSIDDHRPSQILFQKGAVGDGITYFQQGEGNYLFFGLCGKNYELYVTMQPSSSPLDANTMASFLVDSLINDVNDLLQCKPQSFS